jgi:hypothetical protein
MKLGSIVATAGSNTIASPLFVPNCEVFGLSSQLIPFKALGRLFLGHTSTHTALPVGMYNSVLLHYQSLSLSCPCASGHFYFFVLIGFPRLHVCFTTSGKNFVHRYPGNCSFTRGVMQNALFGLATRIPGVDVNKYKIIGSVPKSNDATV